MGQCQPPGPPVLLSLSLTSLIQNLFVEPKQQLSALPPHLGDLGRPTKATTVVDHFTVNLEHFDNKTKTSAWQVVVTAISRGQLCL